MKTFIQYCATIVTDDSAGESTTTTLTGDSGDDYEFEVHALDAQLDAVGAVYAITKKMGDQHTVLYVGHTEDLSSRFKDHHKSECFDKNRADCLCVHVDGDRDSRLKIESDLTGHYHPTCNGRQ